MAGACVPMGGGAAVPGGAVGFTGVIDVGFIFGAGLASSNSIEADGGATSGLACDVSKHDIVKIRTRIRIIDIA